MARGIIDVQREGLLGLVRQNLGQLAALEQRIEA
jgi:hypothetical protein